MAGNATSDVAQADPAAPPDHSSETLDPTRSATRDQLLYELVGGEAGVRKLVEAFYDIVESEPDGHALHLLHLRGHGVAHSRIEQFNFLSGFFGGPKLYAQKWGHSNVREMHEHVEIDRAAKDAWLRCMVTAIDRVGLPADAKARLMAPFTRVATILVNKE